MCKLLCILDIENEDKALEFAEYAVKPMTAQDDDGLGVVLMGDQGLGIERWLKPEDFPTPKPTPSALRKYEILLPSRYNSVGETTQTNLYAIGVHSRKATTPKCLANVHPFMREGIALIHNGIINNHAAFEKHVSSCDSEALLSSYLEHKGAEKLENIQHVADEVTGYYAFMVFNPETRTVDIVRDSTAQLHFASISGVGTVFCTTAGIIKSCAGRLKLPQPEVYEFPTDTCMRWTKGEKEIEAYRLQASVSPSIVDESKCNKWCDHGEVKGTWCNKCYAEKMKDETEKDLPPWKKG